MIEGFKAATTHPAFFRHSEEDGSYSVYFPDFPEIVAKGRHFEEAMQNAEAALTVGLKRRREKHQEIPLPPLVFFVSARDHE